MISVIIPVYNAERHLRRCVESVCAQTFEDLEIILVDDGSTDASGAICEEFARKDGRVVVIHQENGGRTRARNAGLLAAHGEYIGFVDADDWIEANMYLQMHQKMRAEAVDAVLCGHFEDTGSAQKEVFHGFKEGKYTRSSLIKDVYPQMLAGEAFFEMKMLLNRWDKILIREKLMKFQLEVHEQVELGEDILCVVPYLLNCDSIYILHDCFYHYRQSPLSTIKRVREQGAEREQFRILYQTIQKQLENYDRNYDLKKQWKYFCLFMAVPRADNLYRGMECLDYLFPFPRVKRGAKVALYCAGTYGQRLYRYLQRTQFCQVSVWVDRNYKQLQAMGLPVENPMVLNEAEYDAIIVANMFAHSRDALYRALVEKYPKEKVHLMDIELITSEETSRAFGFAE